MHIPLFREVALCLLSEEVTYLRNFHNDLVTRCNPTMFRKPPGFGRPEDQGYDEIRSHFEDCKI